MGKKIIITLFITLCLLVKINAQNYPLEIAILGNSIVGHGPAPEIE